MDEGGGGVPMVCAHGGASGLGNLRVAKTPPLQSAWRGGRCGAHYDPNAAIYASPMHAHTMPPGRPTVVITSRHGKGGHSRVGGQLAARPYSTTPTKNTTANFAN